MARSGHRPKRPKRGSARRAKGVKKPKIRTTVKV
jgi:hypothetical protein